MVHLRVWSWHVMRGWMGCTLLEGTIRGDINMMHRMSETNQIRRKEHEQPTRLFRMGDW